MNPLSLLVSLPLLPLPLVLLGGEAKRGQRGQGDKGVVRHLSVNIILLIYTAHNGFVCLYGILCSINVIQLLGNV